MIDCVYFTEHVRCYLDGRVERIHKQRGKKGWNVVANIANIRGYNQIRVDGKQVTRHRMIAYCFHGLNIDDPTEHVDHINHDTLDNSAANLRVVTHQQNMFNREAKGYTWRKDECKWQASIKIDRRNINLGYFDNEEDAHQAYLDAKAIYHVIPAR